jgi:hypothetical protein
MGGVTTAAAVEGNRRHNLCGCQGERRRGSLPPLPHFKSRWSIFGGAWARVTRKGVDGGGAPLVARSGGRRGISVGSCGDGGRWNHGQRGRARRRLVAFHAGQRSMMRYVGQWSLVPLLLPFATTASSVSLAFCHLQRRLCPSEVVDGYI